MKNRYGPGMVRDAIVAFMRQEDEPVSVQAIYDAVDRALGVAVPRSSVRSYLNINTPGTFRRVARGQYELELRSGHMEPVPVRTPPKPCVVFRYGQSELYQGDCLEFLRSWPERSIHAVVTDPPYGLYEYSESQQSKLRSGKGGLWRMPPSFDGTRRSPLPRFTVLKQSDLALLESFFLEWATALRRILVPGAHVLVASNSLVSPSLASALSASGLERRTEVIRLVMTMRGGDRPKNAHEEFSDVTVMPRSQWEPWLLYREPLEAKTVAENLRKYRTGALRRTVNDLPFGDVIKSHPTGKRERELVDHPSLKPQAFLRQVVRAMLPLGEGVVLDPFAGSGSTLAAAEAVGYDSIGVEIDPHYVQVAIRAVPVLVGFTP